MGRKLVVIALLVFLAFPSSFAQGTDTPVSPFSSVQGMAGLLLEATGYGSS